jgi:VWFA-related protein
MASALVWALAAPVLILFAILAGPRLGAQPTSNRYQQVNPIYRADTGIVAIYATVVGRDGRLVTDLSKDDFQVLDNGVLVQLSTFSNEPQAITSVMLLDMSTSMADAFERVRETGKRFVGTLQTGDRLRIGTFGGEVSLNPLLTSNREKLLRILDEELWLGGSTPLWRASMQAIESLQSETGRRVVVVASDGIGGPSDADCAPQVFDPHGAIGPCPGPADVRQLAIRTGTMFYAIGFAGPGLNQSFLAFVEQTGGGHVEIGRTTNVAAIVDRLAEELRHQYLFGFIPNRLDGRLHTLTIRSSRPGVSVRARKSYLADVKR